MRSGTASGFECGLTDADKLSLLSLARKSIETYLGGDELDLSAIKGSEALNQPLGAFVTLHKKGELRGCIGTFHPGGPLYQVVAQMARQAAFSDYRFQPVTNGELDTLDIEISVLTPMKRIYDPKAVAVGRDGLYIKRGISAGVLLPQVPVEQGWDRIEFLDHTCLKAGLPPGAWKEKNTELYVFQAEVFGERSQQTSSSMEK
ncbi:MAG: AMMECR1 domain-containing protein [candidate division Zixibacteria bacterium RBG_16_53_22]|nr:MAG: AMMECR1 domain-containing protein [candidate division Zixibacteria bacterium RBG_16_53_22]